MLHSEELQIFILLALHQIFQPLILPVYPYMILRKDSNAAQKIRHRTALLVYQLSSSDSLNIITFRDVSFDCSLPPPFVPCTLVPCLLEEVRCNEPAIVAAIVPRLIWMQLDG